MPLLFASLFVFLQATSLQAQLGDSAVGARLLHERNCTMCHSIEGVGGGTAPDFARTLVRGFTPATIAALIWNHGPAMWGAMRRENVDAAALTEQDMRNIYAYFYALRYFDPPGDAARGSDVFREKRCYRCHALTAEAGRTGPAVPIWTTLADPVLWVQEMWNHAGEMAREMERNGVGWPRFTAREMVDLMVYVENLPSHRTQRPTLQMGDPSNGARLFESKNCSRCHTLGAEEADKVDLLETARQERSLTSLAVQMWNHRPLMEVAARNRGITLETFEKDEMADLLGYLFERGYFGEEGNAGRGQRLFSKKGCASCHGQASSGAPDLKATAAPFTSAAFAAAVWRHGPAMLARIEQRGDRWPSLTDRAVSDLIAFLSTK
jgi:cytochrome c2